MHDHDIYNSNKYPHKYIEKIFKNGFGDIIGAVRSGQSFRTHSQTYTTKLSSSYVSHIEHVHICQNLYFAFYLEIV